MCGTSVYLAMIIGVQSPFSFHLKEGQAGMTGCESSPLASEGTEMLPTRPVTPWAPSKAAASSNFGLKQDLPAPWCI